VTKSYELRVAGYRLKDKNCYELRVNKLRVKRQNTLEDKCCELRVAGYELLVTWVIEFVGFIELMR
jgi:hypothetical protein